MDGDRGELAIVSAPLQSLVRPRGVDILKLTNLSFRSSEVVPDDSICNANFQTDGDIGGNLEGTHTDEYLNNQFAGRGGPYEVNFSSVTGDTGDLTGDAIDTWHPLTSQVGYILSATGVANKIVNGTCTIREILDVSNSVTASMQMSAELTV